MLQRCYSVVGQVAVKVPSFDSSTFYQRMRASLVSRVSPELTITNQYYLDGGKMLRPALVLHLAQALQSSTVAEKPDELDRLDELGVLPSQRRLSEIVELIHTASLLHDDVLDGATLRRGRPTAHFQFGTKSAILSGDYMLAQASLMLSELGDLRVIRLLATVIKELVEGELMQMNATVEEKLELDRYLHKSYLKTASLMAKSCEAVACLGGHSEIIQQACYQFGKNLGLAFQLIDDKLDFIASPIESGKEVASDLRNGIVTAPLLFAMEEHPVIREVIGRNFAANGDWENVFKLATTDKSNVESRNLPNLFQIKPSSPFIRP